MNVAILPCGCLVEVFVLVDARHPAGQRALGVAPCNPEHCDTLARLRELALLRHRIARTVYYGAHA